MERKEQAGLDAYPCLLYQNLIMSQFSISVSCCYMTDKMIAAVLLIK